MTRAAPRRLSQWRSALRARGRRTTSRLTKLLRTVSAVVQLFGWLYVAVLVPALLIAGYLVVRDTAAGGDVGASVRLVPLALIWPVAAIALRGDGALALGFPLNALALVGSVTLVLLGWTVLARAVGSVVRWRASLAGGRTRPDRRRSRSAGAAPPSG